MFLVTKWYLDLVTEDGTALIAYAARLRWGALRLAYASCTVSEPSGTTRDARLFSDAGPWPGLDGDILRWAPTGLGIAGTWERASAPIHRRLLKTRAGEIRWACEMPSARARVDAGGRTYEGLGYAERLSLSIPPWKLPFDTLRWGRHVSAAHALVWIDWIGADARRFVWLDGVAQPDACLDAGGVCHLHRGTVFRVEAPRDICRQSALTPIVRRVPGLTRGGAGRVAAALREHKQLARATIQPPGESAHSGWALFETVTW
jgi:hypothetical protein